jgi:adenine-specific DNA-methyltransferase
MGKRTKIELTWIGKENRPRLEPHILLEDPERSYHAPRRVTDQDLFDNRLIFGDNLLALKALEQEFAGKIKCIYIDPPYNTGSAFEHYDDGLEHSLWLSMMRDRLEILRRLLCDSGIIFVSIDDCEAAYLKVLLDEVFGRRNFCGQFVWEKKRKPSFLDQNMASIVEYILCYSPNRAMSPPFTVGNVSEGESYPFYNAGNPRGDLLFPAGSVTFLNIPDGLVPAQDMSKPTSRVVLKHDVVIKDGKNQNAFVLEGEWRYSQQKLNEFAAAGETIVIRRLPFRPRWVNSDLGRAKKMHNLLSRAHYDIPTYEDSASEGQALFGHGKFDYPKPEGLIQRLLGAVTRPGDWVLDSFAGSGTTGAVAHKMGRRWIMVELGEHCHTHIIPRLRKVIDGEDPGGITEAVGWRGGGGFRYFRLSTRLRLHS